ncbi:hypothetical protein YB2330_004183 [Saitoella coloradoensis]
MSDDKAARLASLSKALAAARLTHEVSQLEDRVASSRNITQVPAVPRCEVVVDATAMTLGLDVVKRWVGECAVDVIIPLAVLDDLDRLKKGAETANIKAREAIRWLDRNPTGKKTAVVNVGTSAKGSLRFQGQEERWEGGWEACERFFIPPVEPEPALADTHSTSTPAERAEDSQEEEEEEEDLSPQHIDTPRYLRSLFHCYLFLHEKNPSIPLVTDDLEVAQYCSWYGIVCVSLGEMDKRIVRGVKEWKAKYGQGMRSGSGHGKEGSGGRSGRSGSRQNGRGGGSSRPGSARSEGGGGRGRPGGSPGIARAELAAPVSTVPSRGRGGPVPVILARGSPTPRGRGTLFEP